MRGEFEEAGADMAMAVMVAQASVFAQFFFVVFLVILGGRDFCVEARCWFGDVVVMVLVLVC